MNDKVELIIENCLLSSYGTLTGKHFIASYFERFRKEESIKSVSRLDEIVFRRMYSKIPTSSELLKVRYWRCGHHIPANRQELIRLGFALCLNLDEMNLLLTNVLRETGLCLWDIKEFVYASLFASNERISFDEAETYANYYESLYPFDSTHRHNVPLKDRLTNIGSIAMPQPHIPDCFLRFDRRDHIWKAAAQDWISKNSPYFENVYTLQEWILLSLGYRYLIRVPEDRLAQLKIPNGKQFGQLRHIFYTDLLDCIWREDKQSKNYYETHTYSLDFSSEINRYFKRGAKISRISLIRLLLIFTMPDVDTSLINHLLEQLGFAPLSPNIYTASGVSQDLLLIQLMELFESMKTGNMIKDRALFQHLLLLCDQNICARLETFPVAPKGTVHYKKCLQLKDLRIMAPHSLRKELS